MTTTTTTPLSARMSVHHALSAARMALPQFFEGRPACLEPDAGGADFAAFWTECLHGRWMAEYAFRSPHVTEATERHAAHAVARLALPFVPDAERGRCAEALDALDRNALDPVERHRIRLELRAMREAHRVPGDAAWYALDAVYAASGDGRSGYVRHDPATDPGGLTIVALRAWDLLRGAHHPVPGAGDYHDRQRAADAAIAHAIRACVPASEGSAYEASSAA